MAYKHDDNERYVTTYGQLRMWAKECGSVEDWVKEHIPQTFLTDGMEEAKATLSRFRNSPMLYINITEPDEIRFTIELIEAFDKVGKNIPISLYPLTNIHMLAELFAWMDRALGEVL